ncbi:hypothetical protein BconGalA64_08160 [Burkholderia contaminans]|nr:hypothetical protein BconGalA64_08160 [Burkholderia contaminans]
MKQLNTSPHADGETRWPARRGTAQKSDTGWVEAGVCIGAHTRGCSRPDSYVGGWARYLIHTEEANP